tara:strand:+ start:1364 stop:4765 length:3402 start_codon:yes stop_codon:yes gene_type:complete
MSTTVVNTPDGGTVEVNHPPGAPREQILAYAQANYKPKMDIGKTAAGLTADIAISEGGRMAGAAVGAAAGSVVPVLGTAAGAAVGYVVGGLGSGAAGSIARQKIMNPDGDISWGAVVADSFINLIPGSKAVKGGSAAVRVAKSIGKGSAYGAGIGAGGQVVEAAIDEQRLPTIGELKNSAGMGALLGGGLGATGEALGKAYTKFAGNPTRHFDEAFKKGDPDAVMIVNGVEQSAAATQEATRRLYRDKLTDFQEKHSDENIRSFLLQDQTGNQRFNKEGVLKVVKDEQDYYLQRRIAEGKIQTKHQGVAELEQMDNEFLYKFAKGADQDATALSQKVDDYLHAKHAIDYNERLGDGAAKITTEAAKRRIKAFEKAGLDKSLEPVIDIRMQQSRQILDELVDGGLIAKKTADGWRKTSPDYVPLNRVMDELDDASAIDTLHNFHVGRKEVKTTGQFKAKGSELEVRSIRENIYNNLVSAIKRSEINKANIAFTKLIKANPDTAGEIATVGRFNPRANRNNAMTVFEDGKKISVQFKDPKMAAAFKGTNKSELHSWLKGTLAINRFIGKTLTMWNPLGFTIPNIARDRSEAFVNGLNKMGLKNSAQTLNPLRAGSDMSVITKNLLKMAPSSPKEKELFDLYKDFKKHGGSTGGLAITTVKDVEKNIRDLTKHLNSPTRRKARKLNEILSGINEVAEDATRFGAFRQAIASGMTKDQAALAARDSSFDPMLKGTQMDSISALYLFANPAVQSGKNFIRSMKNPKVGASVMAGLVGLTMGIDKWNSQFDPDWRAQFTDKRGSSWKTNKHLLFVTGKNEDGTLDHVSIPIGYSMVPFKLAADRLQQFISGQDVGDPLTLGKELRDEILDSYNPLGGSPFPTLLRPINELWTNEDGLGREIKPNADRLMDEQEKVYPWTANTVGGELAMGLAEHLKSIGQDVSPETLLYLYQFSTGGVGAEAKRLMEVSSKMFNGEKIESSDIPVLRRFYGTTYVDSWEKRTGELQDIRNLEKQENTNSAKAGRIAYNIAEKVMDAKPEDRQRVLGYELSSTEDVDKAVVRRLETILKEKAIGMTYTDKARKSLGVRNGARALSFIQTIEKLPKEEIGAFIQDQRNKRILTQEVEQQMVNTQRLKELFN